MRKVSLWLTSPFSRKFYAGLSRTRHMPAEPYQILLKRFLVPGSKKTFLETNLGQSFFNGCLFFLLISTARFRKKGTNFANMMRTTRVAPAPQVCAQIAIYRNRSFRKIRSSSWALQQISVGKNKKYNTCFWDDKSSTRTANFTKITMIFRSFRKFRRRLQSWTWTMAYLCRVLFESSHPLEQERQQNKNN